MKDGRQRVVIGDGHAGAVMGLETRRVVEDALLRLGTLLGQDLSLDADGTIGLEFAEGLGCTIEVPEQSEHLYLHAAVGHLPENGRGEMATRLLSRNRFQLSLPASWLALDEASGDILFCMAVARKAFDPDHLPGLLMALTQEVRDLRADLIGGQPEATGFAFASDDMLILG